MRPAAAIPIDNGPLLVMGDLVVKDADGATIAEETRLTLCRCGRTRNQPFCDNSHLMSSFRSKEYEARPADGEPEDPPDGKTTITASRNGSLHFEGRVQVLAPDGDQLADTADVWLCRCGRSGSKPFCDSSHRGHFESQDGEVERDRHTAETPAAFEPNPQVEPPADVAG